MSGNPCNGSKWIFAAVLPKSWSQGGIKNSNLVLHPTHILGKLDIYYKKPNTIHWAKSDDEWWVQIKKDHITIDGN